ncbi:MAG: calcium/sodium antiporter [Alphaproteobacteria bacterium]|nr:calcium/sodium antiporter [Alphaproteobacteria bacterium]
MIAALQILGGFVLLLFGAEFLVRGAVALAKRFNVSPMIIGMTIVAYGTTAPELVVSVEAALRGAPGISVGNVVGSNIANILLILGAAALVHPIRCHPQLLYRDSSVMLGAAFLFVGLALTGTITRTQGILMIAAIISYSIYTYWSERRRNRDTDIFEQEAEEFGDGPRSLWLALLAVIGGIGSVVVGARILISGAVTAARYFGVGEEVIGLTLVAVGTSLPELATAVVAAWRRHTDVAIGNVIGANIYNVLAIMGVVAIVSPLTIPAQIVAFDIWFMLAVTLGLLVAVVAFKGVHRAGGLLFLSAYAAYIALQYYGLRIIGL